MPLYTDPSDASWTIVVTAKLAHPTVPVVAIINPDNGPGTSLSSAYTAGVARLSAAGITVIGYVYTGYGTRSASIVEADMDRWHAWYPGVTGIFFDEQSNSTGSESYYKGLSDYAKAHGMPMTVGNPGSDTSPTYIGTVDLILIYENAGVPAISKLAGWHTGYDRRNFGVIPYATGLDGTFVKAAIPYVGYIYLTNDTLSNPWDSVPSYFGDLLTDLEG